MSARRKLLLSFSLMLILLAGCMPKPTTSNQALPQAIRVQITPALTHWLPKINSCATNLGDANLILDILPPANLDRQTADLIMRFGQRTEGDNFVSVLSNENLVLILHPDNPLIDISTYSLREIVIGVTTNWDQLQELQTSVASYDLPIVLFSFGENNDLYAVLTEALMVTDPFNQLAIYVPSWEVMRQSVADTPGAIGYLLQSQADAQVKVLDMLAHSDLAISLEQPVLAITQSESQGSLRQLLLCLQNSN